MCSHEGEAVSRVPDLLTMDDSLIVSSEAEGV